VAGDALVRVSAQLGVHFPDWVIQPGINALFLRLRAQRP